MKKMFLMLSSVLLAIVAAQANNLFSEQSKDITHVFGDIKRGDRLEIINKFGNVEFRLHDKKEIKALINVKVLSSSSYEAKKLLNEIDVKADKKTSWDKTSYTLKTVYDGGSNEHKKIEINWVVYIPKKMLAVKVNNKFGNVNIGEYALPFEADVQFGNLIIGRLLHNERQCVSVQHGNLHIGEAVAVDAGVRFGKADIVCADYLNLGLQHSSGSVADVNNLVSSIEHSNIRIQCVGNARFNKVAHSIMMVDALKTKFDVLQGSHSKIKIAVSSSKKFEGIKIDMSFTPIELLLPRDINAQCRLSSKMGSLSVSSLLDENFEKNCFEGEHYAGSFGRNKQKVDYTKPIEINITNRFANIKVDVAE